MRKLGLLDEHVIEFQNELESVILVPRLHSRQGMQERHLAVEGNCVKISVSLYPPNVQRLFDDLSTLIGFLKIHLPPSVIDPLSRGLAPNLIRRLIFMRLSTSVPEKLSALKDLDSTRAEVLKFSETITSYGWAGEAQLRAWVNSIPELWVEKRQGTSLDRIRRLLKRGYGDIKIVERVETQVISEQDHLFTGNTNGDTWNASWSDEEEASRGVGGHDLQNVTGDREEEDVSAWGLDDEDEEATRSKDAASPAESEDEEDAWGWGDDKNVETPQGEMVKSSIREFNGHKTERAVTLSEIYNITALPTGIWDLVSSILSDLDDFKAHK